MKATPSLLLKSGVGALTGGVTMIAMVRLILGGFPHAVTGLAWTFILVAMVPWIIYVAWRSRRARLTWRLVGGVLAIDAIALILVWVQTVGPVLALVLSLAGFAVIWVRDWPTRRGNPLQRLVRIDDLMRDPDDEPQESFDPRSG